MMPTENFTKKPCYDMHVLEATGVVDVLILLSDLDKLRFQICAKRHYAHIYGGIGELFKADIFLILWKSTIIGSMSLLAPHIHKLLEIFLNPSHVSKSQPIYTPVK
jgi:hypothetical protein